MAIKITNDSNATLATLISDTQTVVDDIPDRLVMSVQYEHDGLIWHSFVVYID